MNKRPERDTTNPPGQIVNTPPEHKLLSDYIQSIVRKDAFDTVAKEKKLTFEEWWEQWIDKQFFYKPTIEKIWNAAQENK